AFDGKRKPGGFRGPQRRVRPGPGLRLRQRINLVRRRVPLVHVQHPTLRPRRGQPAAPRRWRRPCTFFLIVAFCRMGTPNLAVKSTRKTKRPSGNRLQKGVFIGGQRGTRTPDLYDVRVSLDLSLHVRQRPQTALLRAFWLLEVSPNVRQDAPFSVP